MLLFTVGGVLYTLLETSWRGHTHWTMFFAGGLCFMLLYLITVRVPLPLLTKAIVGGLMITAVEFAFGTVFNLALRWDVWDYSGHRLNLLGQIWIGGSAAWTALSVPAIGLCRVLENYVFGR